MLFFPALAAQSAWVQFFHASALDKSTLNPRNNSTNDQYQRGEIVAANGTVLAESVPTGKSSHPWRRIYPEGQLFSNVVGFTSTNQGNWALEAQYNTDLEAHSQPPQSFEQLLAPTQAAVWINLPLVP